MYANKIAKNSHFGKAVFGGSRSPESRFEGRCTQFFGKEVFDIFPVHDGGGTGLSGDWIIIGEHRGGTVGNDVPLPMDQVANQIA